jgi:putative ABC transport system substrate-binding protein
MSGVLAVLVISLCATIPGLAQDTARLPLVGVMRTGAVANNEPFATVFREELAALGDVEGRDLRLDFRFADGDVQRFPEIAEAFVQEKASVIVVFSEAAAHAAQRATRTIPIIAVAGDFVAEGLGTSLAKPGRNVTGVSLIAPELEAKRLEILKEMPIALSSCLRGCRRWRTRRGRSVSSSRPSTCAVPPTLPRPLKPCASAARKPLTSSARR